MRSELSGRQVLSHPRVRLRPASRSLQGLHRGVPQTGFRSKNAAPARDGLHLAITTPSQPLCSMSLRLHDGWLSHHSALQA